MEAEHICDVEHFDYEERSRLRLRGTPMRCPSTFKTIRIMIDTNDQYYWGSGPDRGGFTFNFFPDQWSFPTPKEDSVDNVQASVSRRFDLSKEREARNWIESTIIMPIICSARPTYPGCTRAGLVGCLLLHELPGDKRGVYRRVGVAEAFRDLDYNVTTEMLKTQFLALPRILDPKLFEEVDDRGNCTVTVL